ncbi:DUF4176 domain-containing protein [Streptococcus gordonii]|uniref:DUF4176 domain-containing protein n=1 Tax=Streptococcus gordonii TaxID=1302 RepID=UPI000617B158|nr:DUF4176 domain-containing protein [Streptococcus gordonii]ALD71413.1 hypothetical protein RN86_02660 [Streptococcus gordonii]AOS70555.1 hypothetical protein WH25_01295 [Streptococcus gordonii]
MSERKHLPIGTVVRVKNWDQNLMITSLFPITEKFGKRGYFDFGATLLPLGVSNDEMAFFNKEDIEEIIFLGYVDVHFQQLIENYDDLVSKIEYSKFIVEKPND